MIGIRSVFAAEIPGILLDGHDRLAFEPESFQISDHPGYALPCDPKIPRQRRLRRIADAVLVHVGSKCAEQFPVPAGNGS